MHQQRLRAQIHHGAAAIGGEPRAALLIGEQQHAVNDQQRQRQSVAAARQT